MAEPINKTYLGHDGNQSYFLIDRNRDGVVNTGDQIGVIKGLADPDTTTPRVLSSAELDKAWVRLGVKQLPQGIPVEKLAAYTEPVNDARNFASQGGSPHPYIEMAERAAQSIQLYVKAQSSKTGYLNQGLSSYFYRRQDSLKENPATISFEMNRSFIDDSIKREELGKVWEPLFNARKDRADYFLVKTDLLELFERVVSEMEKQNPQFDSGEVRNLIEKGDVVALIQLFKTIPGKDPRLNLSELEQLLLASARSTYGSMIKEGMQEYFDEFNRIRLSKNQKEFKEIPRLLTEAWGKAQEAIQIVREMRWSSSNQVYRRFSEIQSIAYDAALALRPHLKPDQITHHLQRGNYMIGSTPEDIADQKEALAELNPRELMSPQCKNAPSREIERKAFCRDWDRQKKGMSPELSAILMENELHRAYKQAGPSYAGDAERARQRLKFIEEDFRRQQETQARTERK